MKRQLVCYCEAKFEADIPTSVDLAKNPETEEEILAGNFMTVSCPACGKLLKPEFPVYFFDSASKKGIDIFFIPELDRVSYYRKTLEYKVENAKRVVIGYEELIEKILLKSSGLDDRVIEIIKYYLLNKALEDSENDREIRIFFHEREKDSLIFHARGLRDDRVGVLKVPFGMVEKVSLQLEKRQRKEPFSIILKDPYISINKLYSEAID